MRTPMTGMTRQMIPQAHLAPVLRSWRRTMSTSVSAQMITQTMMSSASSMWCPLQEWVRPSVCSSAIGGKDARAPARARATHAGSAQDVVQRELHVETPAVEHLARERRRLVGVLAQRGAEL